MGAYKHNVVAVMLIFMGGYFVWVNIEMKGKIFKLVGTSN